MRILLARHGETQWNVEGRCQGQGFDIPLSDTGRDQAMRLGDLVYQGAAHAARRARDHDVEIGHRTQALVSTGAAVSSRLATVTMAGRSSRSPII